MNAADFEKHALDYLEGSQEESERKHFEWLIQNDPLWKKKWEEHLAVENMLKAQRLDHPSPDFTARVMRNLAHYPIPDRTPLVNGILLVAGAVIMGTLCLVLSYYGFFDSRTTIEVMPPFTKYIDIPLPTLQFNGKTTVNIVVALNLVIALMVFDRIILRAVFHRKMHQG